ncbi:adenylate cyclase, terminal-differentiation specific-like, partial [Teleopsis dalmanni]|uniref:adenylate cyclase, terminal-differentiation specific-like n=1 Tax=Teleopsis dalmanni TaxID=139649 RepID=UPI0018CEBB58
LRSAKTPSIATVSKDYCQQPDCIPQSYPADVIPPQQQQSQPQALPPPAPVPPPKPKIPNTFTEIPGTTGVGSIYAKEQQLMQQQHQQQPQQQQQIQLQQQKMQLQPLQPQHPHTTHILPPSAVYSIETSNYQQQHISVTSTALPAREQSRPQHSINPTSIINQPLPDIPQSIPQTVQHQQQQQQQPQTKISPQPLCATNLNQYRSLQRPQNQKMQLSAPAQVTVQYQSQLQQQPVHQQQPPSLPPKNRHKSQREISNGMNIQTLPPKSASLRQQQSALLAYERERERAERHERPRRAETLDNGPSSGLAYMDQFGNNLKKQHSHETNYTHQQQQQQQHYYHHHSSSSKQQQHPQQQYLTEAQQNVYYRSLKRGGSHANNDLYSVTEL